MVSLFVAISPQAQENDQNGKTVKPSKTVKEHDRSDAKKQTYKSKQWRQEDVITEENRETAEQPKSNVRKKPIKLPPPPPPPSKPPLPASPKSKAKNT
jgi:hypothetical protein